MRKFFAFAIIFTSLVMCSCTSKGILTDDTGTEVAMTDISESQESADSQADDEENSTAHIVVYVTGAVNNPGVYELRSGDRIYQAIDMAGGMTEDAAEGAINLAELIEDGQQITVYTEDEMVSASIAEEESSSGLVNINSATSEELCTLPGIGEAKASSIISYREENGKFGSIEDIKNISGIKDGVYSKIKDYICVK